MNIFYLHDNPYGAARYMHDRHVVKMILETAQMLSTAHRMYGHVEFCDKHGFYRSAYVNHPSTRWCRASVQHYQWCYQHFVALIDEYHFRFNTKRPHRCEAFLIPFALCPKDIPDNGFTPPPQCMPKKYKHECTVTAYRQYYTATKQFTRNGLPNYWTTPAARPYWMEDNDKL